MPTYSNGFRTRAFHYINIAPLDIIIAHKSLGNKKKKSYREHSS